MSLGAVCKGSVAGGGVGSYVHSLEMIILCVCEYRKHRSSVGPSKPVSQPRRNIVGCRIQHGWREGNGPVTQWKGTVLDQVPVNPSLYLIKYDGFDCVYGLELNKDERVSALEVLPDRVGKLFLLSAHCCSKNDEKWMLFKKRCWCLYFWKSGTPDKTFNQSSRTTEVDPKQMF